MANCTVGGALSNAFESAAVVPFLRRSARVLAGVVPAAGGKEDVAGTLTSLSPRDDKGSGARKEMHAHFTGQRLK